jgi:hypothetical protein
MSNYYYYYNNNNPNLNNIDKKQEQNNDFRRFDSFDNDLYIKVQEHLSQGKSLKCHHKKL